MSAFAMQSVARSTAALKPRVTKRGASGVRRAVSFRASAPGYKDHGPGYSGSEEKLSLEPIKKIEGTVTLPGSKSMSCLLYTSPSPRDATLSRMPSSA